MTGADVPAVMAMERAAYQFPWSEPIFRDCLKVGYHCIVVETAAGVSGYGVLSSGACEAHVLNICVARPWRGRGIGRALLCVLLDEARRGGNEVAFLEVRPSNLKAIALYESMGFLRIGLRRGYYQAIGGREDAYVYRLDLRPLPDDDPG
jgi:ribosomal-protein-alanine N-acetyltransferase